MYFQLLDCCVKVLVTAFKSTIIAECPQMIKNNDTESKFISFCGFSIYCTIFYPEFASVSELQLMFRLIDRVPDGIEPMLKDLEEHITSTGLADMIGAANIITQVRTFE